MPSTRYRLPLATVVLICGMFAADELQADYTPDPNTYDLEYSLVTEKAVYSLGETVHATYTMTNTLDEYVGIPYGRMPWFNMWIMRGDSRIYTATQTFLQPYGTWWLEPGEVLEWDYTWDMIGDNGRPAGQGEYELMGVIDGRLGETITATTNITVTHAPEPGTLGLMALGALGLLGRRRKR